MGLHFGILYVGILPHHSLCCVPIPHPVTCILFHLTQQKNVLKDEMIGTARIIRMGHVFVFI